MAGEYAESSPFVRLFGKPGTVKILDIFLRRHYDEMPASEVAELADVSSSTFHRNISILEELGIVEVAGQTGNATEYRLNKDSDLARTLADMRSDLHAHAEQILERTPRSQDKVAEALRSSVRYSKKDDNDTEEVESTDQYANLVKEGASS